MKKECSNGGRGVLPAQAPLANPYVPFQQTEPPMYNPRTALVRGTLFTGLDLPFMGMVNKTERKVTPLSQLQTISFAITELALYLDTHREDSEALELYRSFQQMYAQELKEYEAKRRKKCLDTANGQTSNTKKKRPTRREQRSLQRSVRRSRLQ